MQLITERLFLKELELSDTDKVHALNSLPEVDKYNTLGIPQSLEETQKYVLEWVEAGTKFPRQKYVLCIENQAHAFIGLLGINIGKPKYRNAEIWYKLHPSYWNQGYATEVAKAALHFCFKELNLHRVEAGCAVENVASSRVLEKIGMKKEGMKRKLLPIRGEWKDAYNYAILVEDFVSFTLLTEKERFFRAQRR